MLSRKKCTKNQKKGKKIRAKFSLAKHRTRTIKITENNAEVNFVYADMNVRLKLRLHNSIGNKYVYEFNSKEKIT